MILTIRTDKPESELGLYQDNNQLAYLKWHAHRQLAETIHQKIQDLLDDNSFKLEHLSGVVVFEGPGSYTGLRIGFSVGNSLAYGLNIPLIASGGKNWIEAGLKKLIKKSAGSYGVPVYGGKINITKQKK